jgi:hypothetical protein
MNRSDHWQNLARLGELLLTPASDRTLDKVYHPLQITHAEIIVLPFLTRSVSGNP